MELSSDLIDWMWARHHNEWSWYIRSFIILAFCALAWKRSLVGVVLAGVFFPLSAIVFPAPSNPKPYVVEFLHAERQMLEALSLFEFGVGLALVVLFLGILATALWKRSFIAGLCVANLGGVIKLVVSKMLWGEVGDVAILPTAITALVFNTIAVGAWWYFVKMKKVSF